MAVLWGRFVCSVFAATFFFYASCNSDQAPNYSFLKESTTAPVSSKYDYIVVGGGTAGCAIAATLSSSASVLVLERGGSPYGNRHVRDIESFGADLANASPSSPSQLFISEDGVYNHRPRVLGGGSAINAGFYTRASAAEVEEAGWEPVQANKSYEWVEKKVAFQPDIKQWQTMVKEGLLEVGVSPDNGFTYEHISGTKVGGSIFDNSGFRHTAADLLEYADPRKINVYLHAVVHKILFLDSVPGSGSRPRASGVEFKDALGIMHTAFLNAGASNEVILSAGAIGSPQLLMLSGIGPEEHLKSHGIPVILNQPMVGQGMSDNPMNAIMMATRKPVEVSLIQTVGIAESDRFYIEAASGIAFGRIDPQNLHIPTPLINAGTILEKISGPLSTGELKLRNLDPNGMPAVKFNYFQNPDDLRSCVEGMTAVVKLYNSKAFSEFRFPGVTAKAVMAGMLTMPLNLRPRHVKSVVSLDQFCRDTVMTIWHYHGGCRAGKVVDGDYRVMGVDALRVVDGSTLNKSPGTNPQATVMMMGRYVGEKMLSGRQ